MDPTELLNSISRVPFNIMVRQRDIIPDIGRDIKLHAYPNRLFTRVNRESADHAMDRIKLQLFSISPRSRPAKGEERPPLKVTEVDGRWAYSRNACK